MTDINLIKDTVKAVVVDLEGEVKVEEETIIPIPLFNIQKRTAILMRNGIL